MKYDTNRFNHRLPIGSRYTRHLGVLKSLGLALIVAFTLHGCAWFQGGSKDICETVCLIKASLSAACDAYTGNYLGVVAGAADTIECMMLCEENKPYYEDLDPECLEGIYQDIDTQTFNCPNLQACR